MWRMSTHCSCTDMPFVRLAPCPSIFSRSLSLPGSVFPFARVRWHVSFFRHVYVRISRFVHARANECVFAHRSHILASLIPDAVSARSLPLMTIAEKNRPKNGRPEGEKGRVARDVRIFAVKIDSPGRKRKGGRGRKLPRSLRDTRRAHAIIEGRPRSTTSGFSCPPREANRPDKGGKKHWLGFVDVANRASSCALHTAYQRWTDGEKRARVCAFTLTRDGKRGINGSERMRRGLRKGMEFGWSDRGRKIDRVAFQVASPSFA